MVDWSDHKLAKFLRDKDPNWKINELNDELTQFITNGEIDVVVKYKNDAPIDRWIHVRMTALPN